MYYSCGEGHKAFVSDKASDNDYYLLTLMGVAKELRRAGISEADVYLAAGLPLTWVKSQREEFTNYLMRNERIEFEFNNRLYKLRFVGCSVFPQGYTAVIDRLSEMRGVNMLADIGNGTMNIMYITNSRPVASKCWTEKLGVNQCVIRAANAIMDRFGMKIDESIIESVLRYGKADISEKYLACIRSAAREYSAEILDALRKYEYNPELMRLYVAGGGAVFSEISFRQATAFQSSRMYARQQRATKPSHLKNSRNRGEQLGQNQKHNSPFQSFQT